MRRPRPPRYGCLLGGALDGTPLRSLWFVAAVLVVLLVGRPQVGIAQDAADGGYLEEDAPPVSEPDARDLPDGAAEMDEGPRDPTARDGDNPPPPQDSDTNDSSDRIKGDRNVTRSAQDETKGDVPEEGDPRLAILAGHDLVRTAAVLEVKPSRLEAVAGVSTLLAEVERRLVAEQSALVALRNQRAWLVSFRSELRRGKGSNDAQRSESGTPNAADASADTTHTDPNRAPTTKDGSGSGSGAPENVEPGSGSAEKTEPEKVDPEGDSAEQFEPKKATPESGSPEKTKTALEDGGSENAGAEEGAFEKATFEDGTHAEMARGAVGSRSPQAASTDRALARVERQ
ncbi:MAG: hypothetical protein AAFX99_32965, partial [Myxococcota bacterium]